MKKLLIVILVLVFCGVCWADQKYNPYQDRWETTSPDAQLQYNPYEDEFTYEQPDSGLEYNPYEDKFEYAPPEAPSRDE